MNLRLEQSVLHSLWIFWIISFYTFECVNTTNYKMKLISLKKCKIPENRLYKNAPLEYSLSARKINRDTAVITTNFTITERAGPVFMTVRVYQVQQSSSRDLIFNLEKIACTNPITGSVLKVIRLDLDKDCFASPGNYSADKIDIEDFKPILTKAMIGPGKYSYDIEFLTNKGVAACIGLTCDIFEIK